MKRSLSATALQRVRKLSDAVRDVFVSTTTNGPRRTRDDSAFDYGRGRRPRESGLKRSLSHRNISKDDIRPYSRINPSKSTLDLWVGGGKLKDDAGRPRPSVDTPLRSRFSADTDDLVMPTPRGRKTEKKALIERGRKKDEEAKTKTIRPERPPRPIGEDLLSDVFGQKNAVGLAPPPACAVREQLKEEMRRQKKLAMAMAASTARAREDLRHRGSNTQAGQALSHRGATPRNKIQPQGDDAEVGPPVPPKDCVPAKLLSPFAARPRDGIGAALTRRSSSRSAPDGTAGVSKALLLPPRPVTLDERREGLVYDIDMLLYATTGQVETPRTTDTLRRTPSLGNTNIQTPTRSLQHPPSRRPDENKPRYGRAEFRPHKPSPLRSRQPSVAPKVSLPPRPDIYLPEPRHKRSPSEMDLPRDIVPGDGEQIYAPRRPSQQPHATMRPSGRERARELKPKPLPPAPVTSTRMMAKMQGTVRVKEVPRPIQMTMTIATKGHPDSYESDTVVIAPLSPSTSLLSTRESLRDYHDEELIERLVVHTDDPRLHKRDTYTREQLQFALAEAELVRPLSIRKKERHPARW